MKTHLRFHWALVLLCLTVGLSAQVRERAEIPVEYTWDLTQIFADDSRWQAAVEEITQEFDQILQFRGQLGKSAAQLYACLELDSRIDKELNRIYCYPFLAFDLDNRNAKYLSMKNQALQLQTEYASLSSYIGPEILKIPARKLEKFYQQEPGLADYRHPLSNLMRLKEHRFGKSEEKIIAEAGLLSNGPRTSYGIFTNAEMPRPTVTLSDGREMTLNQANFALLRTERNRADRELVFTQFFNSYHEFQGTIGSLMDLQVKNDLFYSRVRQYPNALEYLLDANDISTDVYHQLITNVRNNLGTLHRYLQLRQRMLGLKQLRYIDLYVPLVDGIDAEYSVEKAKTMILEALQPLGEEYTSTVQTAYDSRWIDFYPTPGKRSGAYSMGAAFDVHPYILMNWNGLYANVSTLAHELGHTMHTYFANQNQPYATADYSTFVAEVASTTNEILLFHYQYEKSSDPDLKLSLLLEYIDRIKSTVFRQTQFAEYELRMHEIAESGGQLTGESLTELYREIVRDYYGHDEKICIVDDCIDNEWAYIPHFYRNFYVYQYATSWTASEALAYQIRQGDPEAIPRFIAFLSTGGGEYPVDLLRKTGVDMTTSEPFDVCMRQMNWAMDEVEKILDQKGL